MDNEELRSYMRQYMRDQQITQQELASRLGITQGAVSQVLKGKSAVPESFLQMLNALGLELIVQPRSPKGFNQDGWSREEP